MIRKIKFIGLIVFALALTILLSPVFAGASTFMPFAPAADTYTYWKTVDAHTDLSVVLRLAFSPDGKTIATATTYQPTGSVSANEILIWDAATGAISRRLASERLAVREVAFSSEGEFLAFGEVGGSLPSGRVHIWRRSAGGGVPPGGTCPTLKSSNLFGGNGNQRGTGLSISGGRLYVSGGDAGKYPGGQSLAGAATPITDPVLATEQIPAKARAPATPPTRGRTTRISRAAAARAPAVAEAPAPPSAARAAARLPVEAEARRPEAVPGRRRSEAVRRNSLMRMVA